MHKISGLITALVTPFKNQMVDYESLEMLIERQISDGIQGFVVNGTTAESPTLTTDEVDSIFKFIKKKTKDTIPIILGTGTNSTDETVKKTLKASEIGADAALVVVPYYNKPPQRGLIKHFETVASSSQIPIILYNVPGRTITSLEVESVHTLSQHENIIGIKEASGNIGLAKELREKCGKDFILLSGDDVTYVDFLMAGGNGAISVASHILAKEIKKWQGWVLEGKSNLAVQDLERLRKLINALFCEANPIPVKKALQLQKIISSAELRLPLDELDKKFIEPLASLMKEAGI